MIVRQPGAQERSAVEHTWAVCFPEETAAQIRAYFDAFYRPQDTFVLEEGGVVAASAQIVPYRLNVRGTEVSAFALTGVCTLPEFQGRGYAGAVITHCMQAMRARGGRMGFLFTEIPGFYERLGWAHATDGCLYAAVGQYEQGGYRVQSTERPDAAELLGIYRQWSEGLNMACRRDVAAMEKRVVSGLPYGARWYAARDAAGKAWAYACAEGDVITEQAWLKKDAMAAVLWALPGASLLLPRSASLPGLLPRGCVPRNMARLTDPAALLSALPAAAQGEITLASADPLWGEACWKISAREGRFAVTPGQERDAQSISPQALTQWITGYRPGSALLLGEGGRTLERLLPPCVNFTFEIC